VAFKDFGDREFNCITEVCAIRQGIFGFRPFARPSLYK
jgi:hypothetical protein